MDKEIYHLYFLNEQAKAAAGEIASLMAVYYKELMDNAVPQELAFLLVRDYQVHFFKMSQELNDENE
jgi:hypothetical protein